MPPSVCWSEGEKEGEAGRQDRKGKLIVPRTGRADITKFKILKNQWNYKNDGQRYIKGSGLDHKAKTKSLKST